TILPPDKARGTNNANQLNIFLYQILPNAAWRNMNIPNQVASGETANAPLALTLHYLVTAFGRDNDTALPFGHHLLGRAMSILFDHALLGPTRLAPPPPSHSPEAIWTSKLSVSVSPCSPSHWRRYRSSGPASLPNTVFPSDTKFRWPSSKVCSRRGPRSQYSHEGLAIRECLLRLACFRRFRRSIRFSSPTASRPPGLATLWFLQEQT